MSRHPEVKWAQRVDKVFITVLLPDSKNAKVNLEPEGVFTFSANAGGGDHLYELKLDLYDKVNVEASKINIGVRSIFCVLEKAETAWWKKLLCGDGKPPHYIKVDWDKWVDEDEDKGAGDFDLGGMDLSNFGNMGGMGDDPGEFDDSDDEDQEVAKPAASDADKAEHDPNKGGVENTEEKKEAASST
uniref:Co-chaperone protein p23 n=1 Tax=Rhizophora mucronata TaxID=61149 RepID=A0A2P2K5Z9_RHIMU